MLPEAILKVEPDYVTQLLKEKQKSLKILKSRIKVKEIKFYKVNDEYGFMSNFAPYPFSDGSRI